MRVTVEHLPAGDPAVMAQLGAGWYERAGGRLCKDVAIMALPSTLAEAGRAIREAQR